MKTNKMGFTLVEVLISMSISLMVVAAVLTTFRMVCRASYEVADVIQMNNDTVLLRDRTIRDFRSVTKVVNASEQSVTVKISEYSTGNIREVAYNMTSGKITRSVDGDTPTKISSNIETDTSKLEHSKFTYLTRTGTISSSASADEICGIEIYVVPIQNGRQKLGMTRKVNLPYRSARIQFRNLTE
jgi:type II secretory pathway pseudopilin PulG